ncbi:hypothetical protein D0B54_21755 [Solimonas sp. K1W22B-7]|uniref:hypothetical protein n=1 Tax=Solimonas sp. K1W22B-7 TaxID=2303331 RepID=UPI000E333F30|nr:hypothetical protein [Solimonas sp. K1W22B-7]AXQ31141.1 hypothetical protein D0B54_21755 [Solimonas sp. K1W22B-7]
MRHRLLVALGIGLAGLTTLALSQSPPPDTFSIREAVPADDVVHPGSYTEWWYVNIVNPTTKETFIVTFNSAPIHTTSSFFYDKFGNKSHLIGPNSSFTFTGAPSVCSTAGCLVYHASSNQWHLNYAANGVTADIWLKNPRRGVTSGPLNYEGQTMSWTNPVATSVTSGWFWPANAPGPISVNGWRGYHDHNWGNFDLSNQNYAGWEWAGSHEPNGGAKVMGGVIDGQGHWHGTIVDVDPALGTRYCRSQSTLAANALELSDWAVIDDFEYPRKVVTRCTTGSSLPVQTYTVTSPHKVLGFLFEFTESIGKTGTPGSAALIEHFRTYAYAGS